MNLEPGTILQDRYRITRTLGQGGMGAVYQAQDTSLNVDVAIKVNFSRSEGSTSQFMREAQLLAKLRHPNLPRVIQYFIDHGNEFLVMDYIPGEDLKHLVQDGGPQDLDTVLRWAEQLGEALSYLHRQDPPVFHRDIKPENIKLSADNQAMLVDFGIAKAAYSSQMTQLGARGYTPGYAPPEQYGGGRTGSYTDQYGLAATIYFLLTGQKPLDSVARVVEKKAIPTVQSYNRTIPLHVSQAIEKALSLNPEDRFLSVADFIRALTGKASASFARTMPNPQDREGATMTALGGVGIPSAPPTSFGAQTAVYTPNASPQAGAGVMPPGGITAPPVVLPAKKRFPVGLVLGIVGGLVVIGAIVVVGILYLTGNLFNATPTADAALVLAGTQTAASLSVLAEEPATDTPEPSPTLEPTRAPTNTEIPTPQDTATPEPTATPTPIPIGVLAYISDRGGDDRQIWLMQVGMDRMGGIVAEHTQLTFDAGDKSYPAWSPDGRYLVYSAPGASASEGLNLYRIDFTDDSSAPIQLTDRRGDEVGAAFSADGDTIAYDNNGRDDGLRQIYFVNPDGSNDTRISFDFQEFSPTWHPTIADRYYFVLAGAGGHWTLYYRSATADQSEVETFDKSSFFGRLGEVDHPVISPDLQYIAYTQVNGSRTNIYTTRMSTGGADVYQLTNTNSDAYPSFSMDSNWIAFSSERDGNAEIYIMDLTGQQLTNLSMSDSYDGMPAWYPLQP
ncbi:MAG: serine/threonine-protein kinase [Anaerolineae bacterium]|nr:serine/threonine-protein kinase [Anaerolineae bacterium]